MRVGIGITQFYVKEILPQKGFPSLFDELKKTKKPTRSKMKSQLEWIGLKLIIDINRF